VSATKSLGLASITIPCWNRLEFTRHCIAALMRCTRAPWELIVINNGSDDGTSDYLSGVQDASPVPVTVIANSSNLGFPAAVNQGLKHASGEYLVLLNNDAVVTGGWLEQLIALASAPTGGAGEIGLVGPMSNCAPAPQLIEDAPYRDLDEMHAFAQQWRGQHRGQWFTVAKLSGFCLLMKRAVYEGIGGIDEQFGHGLLDEDDLAARARKAGFELAVAHDLFIHHFGGRSFAGNGIDAVKVLRVDEPRSAARWGRSAPRSERVVLRPWGEPSPALSGAAHSETFRDRESRKIGILHRVRVAWEGDFEWLHSLALVNRTICRRLIERGHDVRLITGPAQPVCEPGERVELDARLAEALSAGATGLIRGDAASPFQAQVHVRHRWPPRMEPPARGKWVLMQPWEYGSLPTAWLPMLRRVDEVWSYSRYVRDCYIEAGVAPDRVHVVPLGVDPELYRPGLEPLRLPAGPQTRFLFVGGTISRKGIDLLLRAFGRAFRPADGVGLVIKEMGWKSFYRGQTAENDVRELGERGYPVEYIDRDLSDAEMAGLYSACDCLVHPFRGEGFGLPVVEAMACGLPVIVTGAGPALDYAAEDTAYFIPAERGRFAECRVGEIETIGRPWLFEPDADVLVGLLKRVAGDAAEARAKGMAASAHIRENFTWAHTTDAVERRLLALGGLAVGQAFQPDVRRESLTSGEPYPAVPLRARSHDQPKVSLTMIVKDEQGNLPHCLGSVAGLFDEIVVVDTGSTDRTREIAREFGARVFDFVWVDDFAEARNAALARATGDYAFWLDADDVIDPPQRARLERLIGICAQASRPPML
jgi:glycosyltransferase involved in cell wall biosynthesis